MNKTSRVLSLATVMIAMTGMMGISFDTAAFAEKPGNGAGGVGQGGYQLNLISTDRISDDECDNNGHRIFVPTTGKFKILLTEGPFAVIDCSAIESGAKVAAFQLPDPTEGTAGCEGTTCDLAYQVHIRVLGQPGKQIDILPTCATLDDDESIYDGTTYCSTDGTLPVMSANGPGKKSKFTDVSKNLLTICVDEDGNGSCDYRIALFDEDFEDFLWEFDNKGAKLVQLRFIAEPTTVG